MVQKYATHSVVLHRSPKKGAPPARVTLPGGETHEFSVAEVKEINDINPGTLIDPKTQGQKSKPAEPEHVADVEDLGDDADDKPEDEKDPEEL